MYNDFKGDLKDFAMVVPVPVVLQKSDIHVVDPSIFQRLNDYSAPRLVEYYDENPCESRRFKEVVAMKAEAMTDSAPMLEEKETRKYGVKVEAQYLVGEYDILLLSANESAGLKDWLNLNGYKIPAKAEEVLDPYIKSNLKFFVVKVNAAAKRKIVGEFLRPIQISFTSPKFMLPIRLGMANADGDQDLIVYAFTRSGRIECTNYRNANMPTDTKVPLFVKDDFQKFYDQTFLQTWKKEKYSVSMLEYAWDVTPANYYHCDPCIATAPSEQDLVQSGVWWLRHNWNDYRNVETEGDDLTGSQNVHFTRLHFRYNRNSFAQDLQFQVTPNVETYQARYVITHPATGNFSCVAGRRYLEDLKKRRKEELYNLYSLTGKSLDEYEQLGNAATEEVNYAEAYYSTLIPSVQQSTKNEGEGRMPLVILGLVAVSVGGVMKWKGMI
jgi:hypothetical protein